MKRLRDNIFTVEVPEWSTQHELYTIKDYTMIKFPAPWGWGKLSIIKENYKIIGTITAEKIDFDPKPYLTSRTIEGPPSYEVYRFYGSRRHWPYTEDAEAAFRSVFITITCLRIFHLMITIGRKLSRKSRGSYFF